MLWTVVEVRCPECEAEGKEGFGRSISGVVPRSGRDGGRWRRGMGYPSATARAIQDQKLSVRTRVLPDLWTVDKEVVTTKARYMPARRREAKVWEMEAECVADCQVPAGLSKVSGSSSSKCKAELSGTKA